MRALAEDVKDPQTRATMLKIAEDYALDPTPHHQRKIIDSIRPVNGSGHDFPFGPNAKCTAVFSGLIAQQSTCRSSATSVATWERAVAKAIKAHIHEVGARHVSILSQPDAITGVVLETVKTLPN